MYYRCPVCNGSGLVEPNFGGLGNGTSKTCPACKGTGMQFIKEEQEIRVVEIPKIIEVLVPCKEPKKYKPWPDPFKPTDPLNPPFYPPYRRPPPSWCGVIFDV